MIDANIRQNFFHIGLGFEVTLPKDEDTGELAIPPVILDIHFLFWTAMIVFGGKIYRGGQ